MIGLAMTASLSLSYECSVVVMDIRLPLLIHPFSLYAFIFAFFPLLFFVLFRRHVLMYHTQHNFII